MHKFDTPKKPAEPDWHPAYVVYRLRLKGLSLRRLSRINKYSPAAAQLATRISWPKMERLIADALGVAPQEIWPSRYNTDGTPRSGLHSRKSSSSTEARNVEVKSAA